jgi:hypothetical protein
MDFSFFWILFSRLLKPLLLAIAVFFSIRSLGFSDLQSLAAASVPFLTGVTNVQNALGYCLAILAVLIAVSFALFPDVKHEARRYLEHWRSATAPPPQAAPGQVSQTMSQDASAHTPKGKSP